MVVNHATVLNLGSPCHREEFALNILAISGNSVCCTVLYHMPYTVQVYMSVRMYIRITRVTCNMYL